MSTRKRKTQDGISDDLSLDKKKKNGHGDDEYTDLLMGDNGNDNVDHVDENDSTSVSEQDQGVVNEPPMLYGEVLLCGGTNWDLTGRSKLPKDAAGATGHNLMGPHRLGSMIGKDVRSVHSGPMACHSVLITTDGSAYSWGRNEKGQLGQGDQKRRDMPTLIESLKGRNIVSASCGKNHTLLLTDKGKVIAMGENKMGQLGLGNQTAVIPSPTVVTHNGPPIKRISAGGDFSMIVDVKGNLFSFGCPEYGQLGHNTDGKYFVTSTKLQFACETRPRRVGMFIEKSRDGHVTPIPDVVVTEVACGANHTAVVDQKNRCFTWGFGGYGRLGHSEPKDEMIPRLVKSFDGPNRGVKKVVSGSTFTLAINEADYLYLWGLNKTTGEAMMYPKLSQDVQGWKVRQASCCHKSIVVLAENSAISWGCAPTFGELGYGENKPKSSASAREITILDGIHIHQIATGFGHTLFIAQNDDEKKKKKKQKAASATLR